MTNQLVDLRFTKEELDVVTYAVGKLTYEDYEKAGYKQAEVSRIYRELLDFKCILKKSIQ